MSEKKKKKIVVRAQQATASSRCRHLCRGKPTLAHGRGTTHWACVELWISLEAKLGCISVLHSSSLSTHSKIQTQGDRSVFLEIRVKLQKDTILMRGSQVSESRHAESCISVNRPLLTLNYYELGFRGKFFGLRSHRIHVARRRSSRSSASVLQWSRQRQ